MRKLHACRAGARWKNRLRKFQPGLPLILMGNVRSLINKMDILGAFRRTQEKY